MTRADLVVRMSQATGWPRASTERALRAMLAAVRAALRRGEPVTLVGFGTFSVARRRPRTLRNPKTGQAVTVAGRTPRFKPSAELKATVR
ncbi:MAG: DNA-binding protein [Candidatus Rokuibacteriota bacterium]|nr:MAG: DNA-binding protein [Candidatus Rokubacteria bacterium]PYN24541.1 MAG: DNA-binding protein [Candidatus Rokubacteria bacterium]PYQ01448.1 MAG: DNA-binding protein [Acidobacteriota bacterium]